jgi:hypothetical protein
MVGHDKLLRSLVCVTPSTGTTSAFAFVRICSLENEFTQYAWILMTVGCSRKSATIRW